MGIEALITQHMERPTNVGRNLAVLDQPGGHVAGVVGATAHINEITLVDEAVHARHGNIEKACNIG